MQLTRTKSELIQSGLIKIISMSLQIKSDWAILIRF